MGKKPNVRSTDQDLRQSLSLAQNAEFSPEARAAKAMFMLNEYMRYFGSINGLCKQIVEVEKEVLCRIGRAAWNEMTQEELDRVLDKHIVNKYITGQLSTEEGQTESLLPKPKSKSKAKRDSLHFLTVWVFYHILSSKNLWLKSTEFDDVLDRIVVYFCFLFIVVWQLSNHLITQYLSHISIKFRTSLTEICPDFLALKRIISEGTLCFQTPLTEGSKFVFGNSILKLHSWNRYFDSTVRVKSFLDIVLFPDWSTWMLLLVSLFVIYIFLSSLDLFNWVV